MIVAVIPCHNEADFIEDVVTRAKAYVDAVLVADDGSTDGTRKLARDVGAETVGSDRKCGFGKNLSLGIENALHSSECDIVVTLDGDGQHNPDEIPQVLRPIEDGLADVVIGSRFLGCYDAPRYRKLGIDMITWLYNVGYKDKITDSQSCFRAYKRDVLERLAMRDAGFGFSTELLIGVRQLGYRITEVPISCIYHKDFHMNSTMNPFKQGFGVALATIKWRLRK